MAGRARRTGRSLACWLLAAVVASLTAACGGTAPQAPRSGSTAPAAAPSSGTAGSAGTTPGSAGTTAGPAGTPVHVKVALGTYAMTWVPLWVAQDGGFFKRAGLDVQLVRFGTAAPANAALESNAVQFSVADSTLLMTLAQKNIPVEAMAGILNGIADALTIRSDLVQKLHITPAMPLAARLQALKGQTIGVGAPGGTVDRETRELLEMGGVTPGKDVKILPFAGGGPGLLKVMKAGQIAGFMWAPPFPQESVSLGYGTLVVNAIQGQVPAWNGLTGNIMLVTRQYATAHPGAVRRMGQALAQAADYSIAHPTGAAALIIKRFGNPQVSGALLTALVKQLSADVPPGARMTLPSWQKAEALYRQSGLLHQKLDLSPGALWTNQFLPAPAK